MCCRESVRARRLVVGSGFWCELDWDHAEAECIVCCQVASGPQPKDDICAINQLVGPIVAWLVLVDRFSAYWAQHASQELLDTAIVARRRFRRQGTHLARYRRTLSARVMPRTYSRFPQMSPSDLCVVRQLLERNSAAVNAIVVPASCLATDLQLLG
jgi:hypothetical protein